MYQPSHAIDELSGKLNLLIEAPALLKFTA